MKVTFRCYIETPTESIIEEYTLGDSETAEWCTLSSVQQEKWKDDWAQTAFLNACSYGTALEVEEDS